MDQGYVKLWRKTIENDWLKNHKLWVFWCYCLIKASHKERIAKVGYQDIKINPGEFIFGRRKASKDLKMHESSIQRCVYALVNSKNISVKSNNKFSIITIINWHLYQQDQNKIEQQANNKRTTSEHRQECKELKNNNISANFKKFWSVYPKKRSKGQAEKTFLKLSLNNNFPSINILIDAIERQKKSIEWKKDNGQFIPYPSSWLNAKGWEDECTFEKKKVIVYD